MPLRTHRHQALANTHIAFPFHTKLKPFVSLHVSSLFSCRNFPQQFKLQFKLTLLFSLLFIHYYHLSIFFCTNGTINLNLAVHALISLSCCAFIRSK